METVTQKEIGEWHRGIYPEDLDVVLPKLKAKLAEESHELDLAITDRIFCGFVSIRDLDANVGYEAADVAICLYALCDRLGINLNAAIADKFAVVKARDQRARDVARGIG